MAEIKSKTGGALDDLAIAIKDLVTDLEDKTARSH